MKNISVHIKKGEKTTFTFKKPIATYGTRIAAKEVTVVAYVRQTVPKMRGY